MRLIRKLGKAAVYYARNPINALRRERPIRSAYGFRVLHRHENQIEREIAATGRWEPAETEAILRIVRAGYMCIDIGANVGYFSLLMSSLGAKVTAFEPTGYGHARMLQNLSLNPELADRITLHKLGLGERRAAITDAIESRFSLRVLAHAEPEPITLIPLDDFWTGDRLDFVKIDVDGHDTSVIRGAVKTLRHFRPIIMAEFCNRVLVPYGSSIADLADAFKAAGYLRCEVLGIAAQMSLPEFLRSDHAANSQNLLLHHS